MASKSGGVDEGKSRSPRATFESSSATDGPRRGLVAKVESYFYENDDFAQLFERFAEEHASVIDLEAEEFKLEYTDVYNRFLALFESSLSRFIESQGGTIEEFYDEVREVSGNACPLRNFTFSRLCATGLHCDFFSRDFLFRSFH